ncbi:hypothetical protein MMC10_008758 [Thelotrema lepadinum]|nr:hypothetical protein [Thelotrema lepadinum]
MSLHWGYQEGLDWDRDRIFSGCYYLTAASSSFPIRNYLPVVQSEFHSTIVSNTVHTTLEQTFSNSTKEDIKSCKYTFPFFEGISVVGFTCQIADRCLTGVVKEKEEAKATFESAVARGETAGLLEQSQEASDVFSTSLGNVPAGEWVNVEITYVAELKNDLEIDGIRLTIPTIIAPRYGSRQDMTMAGEVPVSERGGIKITVDVNMPDDSPIRSVRSPSHPIAVSLGTLSSKNDQQDQQDPSLSRASATLSLGETALEKDFVLMVEAKDTGAPTALLETHSAIKGHRALSATLVPKFSLPAIRPEIVFVADRSGSMQNNIPMLQDAMRVFMRSLPDGVKFNICSFGSHHSFLWPSSQSYTKSNFDTSLEHIETFGANFGGTETLDALVATIQRRLGDMPLEIILLTDGDIWHQEEAFRYIHNQVQASKGQIRLFPLGIGNGVSHALIEGLARSGNGFAQAVQDGERLDSRVVRMLRGALSPHISDYSLEIKYSADDDDNFEVIDKVSDSLKVMVIGDDVATGRPLKKQKTISLHNASVNPDKETRVEDYLPKVDVPKLLQAPHFIPTLFPFSRTTVYMLMSPETIQRNPASVILKATSNEGPLSLEIPIQVLDQPGQTIHQLAARKAIQDLEEGRGWILDARDENDMTYKERFGNRMEDVVKREAVRLGTKFQVANRWCSFVAVESAVQEYGKQSKVQGNQSFPQSFPRSLSQAPDRRFTRAELHTETCKTGGPGGSKTFYVVNGKHVGEVPQGIPQVVQPRQAVQMPRQRMQRSMQMSQRLVPMGEACNAATFPLKRSQLRELAAYNGTLEPPTRGASHVSSRGATGGRGGYSGSRGRGGVRGPTRSGGRGGRGALMSASASINEASIRGTAPIRPWHQGEETKSFSAGDDDDEEESEDVGFCSSFGDDPFVAARSARSDRSAAVPSAPAVTKGVARGGAVSSQRVFSSSEKVHTLIALQRFEGFWAASDAHQIAELMGFEEIVFFNPDTYKDVQVNGRDAWTTALVVAFLESTMASEKEVWEMIVEKARVWLEGKVTPQVGITKMINEARLVAMGF